MRCEHFNEISDEWVKEKNECTNPNARRRVEQIQNFIREDRSPGKKCFTPDEFKEFLNFKGGARLVPKFLKRYGEKKEIEEITKAIFDKGLFGREFQETGNQMASNDILNTVMILFGSLKDLDFVGPGVASACLSLCFPEFCGTADYIVPALLYNESDKDGNINPLFRNKSTMQQIRNSLHGPFRNRLTPYAARKIATLDYTNYIQDFWRIKRIFSLKEPVRRIEAAFWSFGICYLKRDKSSPLLFRNEPTPPKGGSFSKRCPNED